MLAFGEAPIAGNGPKQFVLKGRHRCLEPFGDSQSLSSMYRHNLSMGSFDHLGWAKYRQHVGHTKPSLDGTILPSSCEDCVQPHTTLLDTAWSPWPVY